MNNKYDTIVLGLGAMGSAALYQLAKRGNKVLGIDQFSPPHVHGSSHGDTRITRQAIGEGDQYTPLALRSYQIWEDLERETGRKLLEKCGGLIISSGAKVVVNHVEDFFENTVAAAEKFGIQHEILDVAQVRSRFPQFNLQDNEVGYYESGAGFLRPEECVRAQLDLAEKYGAAIHRNEKVVSFIEKDGIVHVQTEKGEYKAGKLVVCAGSWLLELIGQEHSRHFKIIRQVLYWFELRDDVTKYTPDKMPIFIWELQGNKQGIYGFPAVDGLAGGLKIATEQYETTTTPEAVQREVTEEETATMYKDFVEPYLPGLGPKCLKSVSCLYTVTPDSHFVIDTHPDYSSVILASPCSGHGFKHSAAIGEVLSELVMDGKSKIDISAFKMSRFN